MRVRFHAQGNNRSLWWGLNSREIGIHPLWVRHPYHCATIAFEWEWNKSIRKDDLATLDLKKHVTIITDKWSQKTTTTTSSSITRYTMYLLYTYHVPIMYLSCTYPVPIMYLSCTYHVPIIYLSSTYHLPIIYLSSTYHLPIIYLSCFIFLP